MSFWPAVLYLHLIKNFNYERRAVKHNFITVIGLNNFNPIGLSPCIKLSNFFCCRIWIHHVWLGLALLLYITDINNSEPQEHHTIRHKKGVKTRKQVPGGRGEGACAQHGPPACLARNKMNLMLCSIDKKGAWHWVHISLHCLEPIFSPIRNSDLKKKFNLIFFYLTLSCNCYLTIHNIISYL